MPRRNKKGVGEMSKLTVCIIVLVSVMTFFNVALLVILNPRIYYNENKVRCGFGGVPGWYFQMRGMFPILLKKEVQK